MGSPDKAIPTVLTVLVLDPTGERVVASDIAENEAGLGDGDPMTLSLVEEFLELTVATLVRPFLWEPETVLLAFEGAVEWVSMWEAEVRLNLFVREQRGKGQEALDYGELEMALEFFDRARRVSGEDEDVERVASLCPEPEMRRFFRSAL